MYISFHDLLLEHRLVKMIIFLYSFNSNKSIQAPMEELLCKILWRTCKKDVLEQIDLQGILSFIVTKILCRYTYR